MLLQHYVIHVPLKILIKYHEVKLNYLNAKKKSVSLGRPCETLMGNQRR